MSAASPPDHELIVAAIIVQRGKWLDVGLGRPRTKRGSRPVGAGVWLSEGGGRNELPDAHGPHLRSELAPALRASFARKPPDGYFFRAEFQAHFASLLEQRRQDPDFLGSPFTRYGGASLHTRSHGEAFLVMLVSWMHPGMVIMDEPEAALSPQRQLTLLARMARLGAGGGVQFVVATHSAILLTLPGATIVSFDGGQLKEVGLEETPHYQITRGILESPARYWKHLMRDEEQ